MCVLELHLLDSCVYHVFRGMHRTAVSCVTGLSCITESASWDLCYTESLSFTSEHFPRSRPFTLFYSSLFQRQAWPELGAKPEDPGQVRPGSNGWRTTGAPSKCHSCLKLEDSFPPNVLPTHWQWKDQMCLYTWIKKNGWCLKCIWQSCKSEWDYATNAVWPLHCQTVCEFSCSILVWTWDLEEPTSAT